MAITPRRRERNIEFRKRNNGGEVGVQAWTSNAQLSSSLGVQRLSKDSNGGKLSVLQRGRCNVRVHARYSLPLHSSCCYTLIAAIITRAR